MRPSGFTFSIAHSIRSAGVRQGAVGNRLIHVRLKDIMKERATTFRKFMRMSANIPTNP
jgi:hypothetical protein